MRHAQRLVLLLAALAPAGCGKGDTDTGSGGGGSGGGSSGGGSSGVKPPAEKFSRFNYRKVREKDEYNVGSPVSEVEKLFGYTPKIELKGDVSNYTWAGDNKDQWFTAIVRKGYVERVDWPGKFQDDLRRGAARGNLGHATPHLRKYALAHRSKLPSGPDDLPDLKKELPKVYDALKSGEVVVPWGKSANSLLWGWWKDTPETGGPYLRFDGTHFGDCTPEQFTKLRDTALTFATFPSDMVDPKSTRPPIGSTDGKGPPPGFWFCESLFRMIGPVAANNPVTSLDEFPKYMAISNEDRWALYSLEKNEVVIKWGQRPDKGVWAYPTGFPKYGGWAVVNRERRVYTAEEAVKLLAEP